MSQRLVAALAVAVALGSFAVASCRRSPPGWQPLWHDHWEWGHRGELWVRGVPADGRVVDVPSRDLTVRCDLVNLGEEAAAVGLQEGGETRRWLVEPGQALPLQLEGLERGARFSAPETVVLASPRVGRPLEGARLVVFIVVDTLRADHVTSELMPGVTEYFQGGRRWRQATANASWTLPSVTSLFTSRPVFDVTTPEGDLIGIPAGLATWAVELESAGFVGAAVVANYTVAVLNGFGAGFSTYRVPDGHGEAPHPDARWVVEGGRDWLGRHEGESAFLYLHLMDPHHPYRSHEDPTIEAPDLISLHKRQREERPGERGLLSRLYSGEVRHVDRELTRFLRELPADAVVLLTSDHGESLGERSCWGHGLNLYQESLLVPLLMRGPGVPAGTVDDEVQLLDLAPTVLDVLGLPSGPGMRGHSLIAGGPGQPVVSATFGAGPLRWSWRRGRDKVLLHMAAQPGLGAVARSRMEEGRPLEPGVFFYDLEVDPGEESPAEPDPAVLDSMVGAFGRTAGRMVPGLQVSLSGHRGPASTTLGLQGKAEVVQAWSVAPMTVRATRDRLELDCENAHPFCAVAASVEPTPASVSFDGAEVPLAGRMPPAGLAEGLSAWWNPPRPLVVSGFEETLSRLEALGYIP